MIQASFSKYILDFKRPSGTSRGVLHQKKTYFIQLISGDKKAIGECGILEGLSVDPIATYEQKLQWVCDAITQNTHTPAQLLEQLTLYPSIQIGVEQAFLSLASTDGFSVFPSDFSKGDASIAINGLVWMGDKAFMQQQIQEKITQGFTCIKMKIGAIDFNTELSLLKSIRANFSAKDIELRVDANGAFSKDTALEKLKRLSDLDLHSIEQPIKQGQWQEMALLCEKTPLPIVLDEELLGVFNQDQELLLQTINPQYIILKPSLVGGFKASEKWISLAKKQNISYWITSALESNIGLNAIAQWTYTLNNPLPQGLGTGSLYTNNITSPLTVANGILSLNPLQSWHAKALF